MQIATNIRNWGAHASATTLADCAKAADDSALDAIWVNDHVVVPPDLPAVLPDMASGEVLEPLATLAYLAALTRRVGLGIGVLVAPYRPPVLTAKWVATIQALSAERMILGLAPGYLGSEFRALGLDPRRRGAMTDDVLDVLGRTFAQDSVELNGETVLFRPRPAPPPILIGGAPENAWKRALRYGAGWIPAGISGPDLKPLIAEFRQRAAEAGNTRPMVVAMKTLPLEDPSRAVDAALEFAAAGADQLVHTQGCDGVDAYRRVLDALGERVIPAAQGA